MVLRSRDWRSRGFLAWTFLICFSTLFKRFEAAPEPQKPAAAYAPLFTGTIKFADVPEYASPAAPPVLAPVGRRRRLNNFPPAPELSATVLERVINNDAAAPGGHRRLQQQQQQQATQLHVRLSQSQQQQQQAVTAQQTVASKPLGANSKRRLQQRQQHHHRQQQQQSNKQRPGWTGLWWADAGGVGLAVGPNHALHAVSTVLAVYSIDQATGNAAGSKVVALQDLFAPVGAENCKDGVYDAMPRYDKAAGRYLIAATCSGKGAALLAVSATGDPTGSWFMFTLLADGDGTGLACTSPRESAVADAVRLTYDNNGVYISLFNYCPSNPETQGATLLALPKYRVYKGAPNFVYAVFTADQISAAVGQEGLGQAAVKQCQPAPPQTARDAAGNAAYFVCDHIGPDSTTPRTAFILVSIINTGALWQLAGTRDTSPTCFLTANVVQRGVEAPVSATVMLQQPQGGSQLHAGGTTPPGSWSGSAVLANSKVYTVDRIDVTETPKPPLAPVTMPSLMWTEIDVTASMSGAGDCARTESWGGKWDWSKDWSIDWGKDFDLEWEEHKDETALLQQHVAAIEEAAVKARLEAAACAAAFAANASSANSTAGQLPDQQQDREENGVSDGSAATVDGAPVPEVNITTPVNCSALTSTSNSSSLAAETTARGTPLRHRKLSSKHAEQAVAEQSNSVSGTQVASDPVSAAVAAAAKATASGTSSSHLVAWRGMPDPLSHGTVLGQRLNSPRLSFQQAAAYYGLGAYEGWALGCWYCTSAGGLYYSSSWFYKYWYANWDFGWYRQYKLNYAPGWSKPVKGLGRHHLRHLLQDNHNLLAVNPSSVTLNVTTSGNDTIVIPPCLLTGQSYKNTCKQCNYTNFTANVTVNLTRFGVISKLGPNPIGFVVPSIAVTPGGSIILVSGYSGPGAHPNSSMLAYPGIASLTIQPGSTEATWKVLRTGAGKVKSTTGRWTDFSSTDIIVDGTASGAAQLYHGVQWSQRVVECDTAETNVVAEYEPVCAMPAPWIGHLAAA